MLLPSALRLAPTRWTKRISSASLAFLILGPAHAQPANDQELPAIRVTGERVGRDRQQTFTSTGVVTGQEIEDLRATDVRDAFRLFGNVGSSPSNNGNNGITIRGINSEGLGEPGGNLRPLTSLVIDGASQSFEGIRRGSRGLWDVEQIEVLRGPQSSLQGRNALAGAVIVNSRDPTFKREAAARLTFGERDTWEPAFMLSGPLVDRQLAFRLSGEQVAGHKGITQTLPGTENLDHDTFRSIRGRLLFTPTAIPGLRIRASLSESFDRPAITAVSGPDFFARRLTVPSSSVEIRANDVRNRVLDASYTLSPSWTLTSVSSWVNTDARISTPFPNFQRRELRADSDFTQDLRATFRLAQGRFTGVVGMFYGDFDNNRDSLVRIQGNPALPALTIQNLTSTSSTTNRALYADTRWEFAPRWFLLTGLRQDRERSSERLFNRTNNAVTESSADFSALLPKLGIAHSLTPTQTIAFTASKGYRAGFFELGRRVDPEELWSYDIAYRSQWFDRKLTVNANVFTYDWRNQQIAVPNPSNFLLPITVNAGQSSSIGGELEISVRPAAGWRVGSSIGYLSTRLDQFRTASGDFSGNQFPEAPRWSGSAFFTYRNAQGFFAAGDVSYKGQFFATSDLANQRNLIVPGRTLANLRVGYEWDRYSVTLFISNLFDRDYISGRDIRQGVYVGDQRLVGMTLAARFP